MTDVEPYDPEGAMRSAMLAAERRASSIRLRNAGASMAKIAHVLKYATVEEASADLIDALREINMIPAGELVARQQAIIMDMTRACYANALSGDVPSVKMIKELMDHQAKLFGLYAPTRHRISPDDVDFTSNATKLLKDLGVTTVIDIPPTVDVDEPWAV